MNEKQLKRIASKTGFGLPKGWGVKPAFSHHGNPDTASEMGAWKARVEDNNSGKQQDLESASGYESLLAQCLQIGTTEKVRVSLEFFRSRLADYSRAISEKADIDFLTQSGLVEDDSQDQILLIDKGQVKVGSKEEERVEITLEFADVDLDNLWVPRTKFGQLGIRKHD
jgi:hypothetical protein